LWGILQTCFQYIEGGYSTLGPTHIVVAGVLIFFRERRRYTVKMAVHDDAQRMHAVWECIQQEPLARDAMTALERLAAAVNNRGPASVDDQVRCRIDETESDVEAYETGAAPTPSLGFRVSLTGHLLWRRAPNLLKWRRQRV